METEVQKGYDTSLRSPGWRTKEHSSECLQETKLQQCKIDLDLPGYHQYWNYDEKKGYSGTAIFTKHEPLRITYGIGIEEHDHEGRVITLEYPTFYLICVYVPNSQRELTRLDYRMTWEDAFLSYIKGLEASKPVIYTGDLNVAHEEIDLKNPKTNTMNAGFTREERDKLSVVLSSGYTDSFRFLYPDRRDAYTWWSYMMKARERNIGWRIDYFIVSDTLRDRIRDAWIDDQIMGSDHCPVGLQIEVD